MNPIVIVPTYNEVDNLAPLVRDLLKTRGLYVLVVDDASTDGTAALADRLSLESPTRVSVLHRTSDRGLGRAYVEGMKKALVMGGDPICQMDADFSHNPADLPRLLNEVAAADLIIGSRYVPGGRIENWSKRRRLLSAFANRYVRAVTGLAVRDCTSGFRCWRHAFLQRLPLDHVSSDGYAFLVEMTWLALASKGTVLEVPITFTERRQGGSKLGWRAILESVWLPWSLRPSHSSGPIRSTLETHHREEASSAKH